MVQQEQHHRLAGCVYGAGCKACSPYHLAGVMLDPQKPFMGQGSAMCVCGKRWAEHEALTKRREETNSA